MQIGLLYAITGVSVMRIWLSFFIIVFVAATLVPHARTQDVPLPLMRPPAQAMQLQRAQTAWESGVGLLEVKARVDLVLRARQDDVQALILRAKVALAMDDAKAAFSDAAHAVRFDSTAGEAHLLMAESALVLGESQQAERALRQASEYSIEDAIYHVRLSAIAMRLEQLERAESYARVALNLHPDEPAAYYQLARVFMEKGYKDAAVLTLKQGFDRGVLDSANVQDDPSLSVLASDVTLTPWMQR
ncbi:MAG: hypothetical protein RhofKO_39140 [Rhodothermales bacterium]